MSNEILERIGRTEPLIHPRQLHLTRLLLDPNTPPQALPLIREATREYDAAFGGLFTMHETRQRVEAMVLAGFSTEDEPSFLAVDTPQLFTVSFYSGETPVTKIGSIVEYGAVCLDLGQSTHGIRIFPDFVRYVGIDEEGNSLPTQFLLYISEHLRNTTSEFEVAAFRGEKRIYDQIVDLKFR